MTSYTSFYHYGLVVARRGGFSRGILFSQHILFKLFGSVIVEEGIRLYEPRSLRSFSRALLVEIELGEEWHSNIDYTQLQAWVVAKGFTDEWSIRAVSDLAHLRATLCEGLGFWQGCSEDMVDNMDGEILEMEDDIVE